MSPLSRGAQVPAVYTWQSEGEMKCIHAMDCEEKGALGRRYQCHLDDLRRYYLPNQHL